MVQPHSKRNAQNTPVVPSDVAGLKVVDRDSVGETVDGVPASVDGAILVLGLVVAVQTK